MKIMIDTNVFLDFYRSKPENLEILRLYQEMNNDIVFPIQIYDEFKRNRLKQIDELVEKVKRLKSELNLNSSIIMDYLVTSENLSEVKKEYENKLRNIINKLNKLKEDTNSDPVYKIVENVVMKSEAITIDSTKDIIEAAYYRKLAGKPPGENSKFSIGDQIVWEAILKSVKDDIIIVTRDNSFKNNYPILSEEYRLQTGFNMTITDKITDALETAGIIINQKLKELESIQKKFLQDTLYPYQTTEQSILHISNGYPVVISGDLRLPSELKIEENLDFIKNNSQIKIINKNFFDD